MTPAGGRLPDALVSLSLANLCLLRVWGALLSPANHYFLARPPAWHTYVVAVLATLALAAAFFFLGRLARDPAHPGLSRLAPWGLLAASVVALNALRQHVDWLSLQALSGSGWAAPLVLAALLMVMAALAVRRSRHGVVRAIRLAVLAMAPFCAVTFFQAAAAAWTYRSASHPSFDDKPTAPSLRGATPSLRLVFLVFDALDQNLLFSVRPADLRLPRLDRLRAEAVVATEAYPVDHSTAVSLPSLITGQPITRVKRTHADELRLWLPGAGDSVSWSEENNLFRRARGLGANGALIGWYHPYCRVLARDVASCAWFPYVPYADGSWAGSAGNQLGLLIETVPLAVRLDIVGRLRLRAALEGNQAAWHLRQYRAIQAKVLEAVSNPDLGLVFVHYPVPHWPYIYDRSARRLDITGRREYADNLALVDETLTQIDAALTASGMGARTAVLLTSDHWQRRSGPHEPTEVKPTIGRQDQRVPLILSLPGGGPGATMAEPILNIVAQDMALAVLRGELTSHEQAAAWLRARSLSEHQSPARMSSAGK